MNDIELDSDFNFKDIDFSDFDFNLSEEKEQIRHRLEQFSLSNSKELYYHYYQIFKYFKTHANI